MTFSRASWRVASWLTHALHELLFASALAVFLGVPIVLLQFGSRRRRWTTAPQSPRGSVASTTHR